MRAIRFRAWDGKKMRPWGFLADGQFTGIPTESGSLNYSQMQYTGLKDKNGVEIYDGDILRHHNWNVPNNVSVISWDYEVAGWDFGNNDPDYPERYMNEPDQCHYEVIGNVYENPELLEPLKEEKKK